MSLPANWPAWQASRPLHVGISGSGNSRLGFDPLPLVRAPVINPMTPPAWAGAGGLKWADAEENLLGSFHGDGSSGRPVFAALVGAGGNDSHNPHQLVAGLPQRVVLS